MRICVFGIDQSFGLDRIGGTDSFFRRLAGQWRRRELPVSFVHYRCAKENHRQGWAGIESHEYVEFEQALKHLENEADVVLVNTLHRNHRIAFGCFRRRWRARKKFFIVYSLFREQPLWRQVHFLESIVYPYSHGTLCMSPRLTRSLGRWCRQADLVWPPVAQAFYCPPQSKPPSASGQLRVTYIGRTEPGKGIDQVIAILQTFKDKPRIQLTVHGYHFPGDDEAVRRHRWLADQGWLDYRHHDIQSWSPDLEQQLAHTLHHTDILLLPYSRLSSSIDTPLLLIEGMAASCCILTRPFGDIPAVYGQSPLLVKDAGFVESATALIASADQWIEQERERVFAQAKALAFDETTVAGQVLQLIETR